MARRWSADATMSTRPSAGDAASARPRRHRRLAEARPWPSCAARATITAIVPVGHGAAAVLMDGDAAVAALDYEAEPPRRGRRRPMTPSAIRSTRRCRRGCRPASISAPSSTGWSGCIRTSGRRGGRALLWPQYWAWWLCGERASEVTSLGCHSDLWRPPERRFSDLARAARLGRAARARCGGAGDVLGPVRPALAAELGLPRGLPRSIAACTTATPRCTPPAAFAELAERPFAVVSTGTWFVCARRPAARAPARYDPAEDMLANVDVDGRPTPTARFMGGRDYEAWMGDALGAAARSAAARAKPPRWPTGPRAAAACAPPAPPWNSRAAPTARLA